MKNKLITFITILSCLCLNSQEAKVFGDSLIVAKVKAKTSMIFDNKDKTSFYLTKKRFHKEKTYGTNIIAHSKNGNFNRIIAITTTKKGILSAEYYYENTKLIYIYQTFEYFNKYKDQARWKNFKGLPAWENKYYISENKIIYQKQKGLDIIKKAKKLNEKIREGYFFYQYVNRR